LPNHSTSNTGKNDSRPYQHIALEEVELAARHQKLLGRLLGQEPQPYRHRSIGADRARELRDDAPCLVGPPVPVPLETSWG